MQCARIEMNCRTSNWWWRFGELVDVRKRTPTFGVSVVLSKNSSVAQMGNSAA